jgi:hypothetical protein
MLVGGIHRGDAHGQSVVARSADGRTWAFRGSPISHLYRREEAETLIVGRNGFIAIGGSGLAPSGPLWLQSGNGRTWRGLKTFAPLGMAPIGEVNVDAPNGKLGADGIRMIAIRTTKTPIARTSFDGGT